VIYLSGHVGTMRHPQLGFLITPDTRYRIPEDAPIAVDNACYSNPIGYSDERYLRWLAKFPARCLFASAPDVVGDHAATVERSLPMLPPIRALGLPAAFCAQDGWDEDTTPWDQFDVLFVGGTTEFKFRGGREAVRAAKRRGKRTHMGRVNSEGRLRAAAAIGCDTADGTFLRFGPETNSVQLFRWLDSLIEAPMMVEYAFD
jgi:hypothetical protein